MYAGEIIFLLLWLWAATSVSGETITWNIGALIAAHVVPRA